MSTAQLVFEGLLWEGATGSHLAGSDVSHVTGSDISNVTGSDVNHVPRPEVCSAHAQREVAQYLPYWGLLTGSDRDRKRS